ncbi:MAG: IS30 family transposase [Burkholderiaceae bacterium]|nr:IS30 family transposase [Microbacteriaceae bacterium]
MPSYLTTQQKRMAFHFRKEGMSLVQIARQIGCSAPMVGLMVRAGRHTSGVPDDWDPRPGRLTVTEREQILIGLGRGDSMAAIARALGRSPSTVSREIASNGGPHEYRAWFAHRRARSQARRPKLFKLRQGRLLAEVSQRLLELWSPDEIAQRLRLDYPDEPEMRVSHETIYQSPFRSGSRRTAA